MCWRRGSVALVRLRFFSADASIAARTLLGCAAAVEAPRQFFDLHDMFVRWVNLPQCKDKQLDYSQFLQALGRFEDIPEQEKVRRE